MKKFYYLKIYKELLEKNFKIYLEYKIDFFIGIVSIFFQLIMLFLFFEIYFYKFKIFPNWKKEEFVFMYSISVLISGIYNMFFQNLWSLGWFYIREGELDYLMVRPINVLFQICTKKFLFENIILIVTGFYFLFYTIMKLNITLNLLLFFQITVTLVSGIIIIFSLNLFFLSMSFWIDDSTFIAIGIYNLKDYGRLPLEIFPKIIQFILTFVLPYSFTSYYPSLNILLKNNKSLNFIISSFLFSIVLFIFSYKFWLKGLKKYRSTN